MDTGDPFPLNLSVALTHTECRSYSILGLVRRDAKGRGPVHETTTRSKEDINRKGVGILSLRCGSGSFEGAFFRLSLRPDTR